MTQATTYSVPLVGPASPTVMAQRIDDNFDAIISGHSGSARPTYAVAGMIWEDTSVANETRLWFYDGSQDILVAVIDTQNDRVELAPQPLVDVASAATTDIGAVKSRNIRVTGTTTITSFGTVRAGTSKTVYFAAALTVTYNATSLITPTGTSLAVAAGDSIDLVSLGSGNWRVLRRVKSASASIAILQHQAANGTGGGTSAVAAWTTRPITTEVADADNIVSISSNQFTTTIDCMCSVVACFDSTNLTRMRLWNVTDSVEASRSIGGSFILGSNGAGNLSLMSKVVAGKTYRVEYYTQSASSAGLGRAVSDGGTEVYMSVTLQGLAA